jgi:hypothetical protein
MRRGNVLIANALGSNLLESSALLGFLPRLCERLLGEDLKMPSVATWWCGEPVALKSVIENLDHLVVKPAFPGLRVEPMFGEDLDERGRRRVTAMLRARPNDYVAQEIVRVSQAPVLDRSHHRRLVARAIGLRVFACASPNGYVVMPGGLTRVASAGDARTISMQRGGSSKDTWVMAAGPVSTFSLLRRSISPEELVRAGTNLSSRVVENLFWFGRYCERCDAQARLLRVALGMLVDEMPGDDERVRPIIIELLAPIRHPSRRRARSRRRRACAHLRAGGGRRRAARSRERTAYASRTASHLRERLSLDNWRTLNRMTRGLASQKGQPRALADVLGELDITIGQFTTLSGYCARRHDARSGLAVPVDRAPHRAAAVARSDPAAGACQAAGDRPDVAAAARRLDHYLSGALHEPPGVAAGARPAGARRSATRARSPSRCSACATSCAAGRAFRRLRR